MIVDYKLSCQKSGDFEIKRAKQKSEWLDTLIQEMLAMKLKNNAAIKSQLPQLKDEVLQNTITPYQAAQKILALF
jgi:LAO/AO transport system kinase